MKSAQSLVPSALSGKHAAAAVQAEAPRSVDPATAGVVNKLFAELQCIFPAWKQAWPDEAALAAAKKSWIKAFMAAGISSLDQIRFGIQQCRQHGGDFAPSVGKFIAWCQPTAEMLGLPEPEKAYREATRNAHPSMAGIAKWSHAAVYHAAHETGFYNLNSLPMDVSRKLFDRNYAITVRMVIAGEPLKALPLALPEKVDARCTPEVARSALEGLRKTVRGPRHD
jgi:hypothetical protein